MIKSAEGLFWEKAMIKSVDELQDRQIEIDLTGPAGNAFVLLGYAQKWAKDLGLDWEVIEKR